jgi:fatty-acid desaturase
MLLSRQFKERWMHGTFFTIATASILILALITLGERWHNNHHHYAVSAQQGFY